MQDVILSVQDLEVEFTLRGKTLHAIRGISLDICEGESLAIVGEASVTAKRTLPHLKRKKSGSACAERKSLWSCRIR